MTLYNLRRFALIVVIVTRQLVASCSFPDVLQIELKDPPWYSYIRTNGSGGAQYYIRHNVMDIHNPNSDPVNVRWKCAASFHDKLLLKRQNYLVNSFYRCAKFVIRSRSVVQIMWSHEVRTFDLALCDDLNLKPDPWILIWYDTLMEDYSPCPFSGGFDMKIVDSLLGENGCNLMLRPMRLEAECLGGEGVTFNFMSSNCVPDIKMYVQQRTTCVTGWQDNTNNYVILRRNEEHDLWCLVIPIHRNTNFTAYLFSDLACVSDISQLSSKPDIRFFTLHLHVRVFSDLCEDEYEQCNTVTCNKYVKQECQKSCGVCNNSQHPLECEFPHDSIGEWFLNDPNAYSNITISSSIITVSDVGSFFCVSFPNGPSQPSLLYTTISLTHNGCRPRFTCIKLQTLGPSVLQYSLSQSYTWPTSENDLGIAICNEERFLSDPSPIDDRYRSHEGAGKPITTLKARPVVCNLTSVFSVNATSPSGSQCSGSLYRHCEDTTKLRLDFNKNCGNFTQTTTDYKCLANFQGHYWERIVYAVNVLDERDVVCFVFSQFYPNEAYSLVASMCDQKSFSFARSRLRNPQFKLDIQAAEGSCQSVPYTSSTLEPIQVYPDLSDSDNPRRDDLGNQIAISNITSPEGSYYIPVSIFEPDNLPKRTINNLTKGTYLNTRNGPDIPSAKSTSVSDENSLEAAKNNMLSKVSNSSLIFLSIVFTLLRR